MKKTKEIIFSFVEFVENSQPQVLFLTSDFRIYLVHSKEDIQKLLDTCQREEYTIYQEVYAPLPEKSDRKTRVINCSFEKNPALHRIVTLGLEVMFMQTEIKEILQKPIESTEAVIMYLLSQYIEYSKLKNDLKPKEEETVEDILQDSFSLKPKFTENNPKNVELEEDALCANCGKLEPFTPTFKLATETYCLDCASGCCKLTPAQLKDLRTKSLKLQINHYYKKVNALSAELYTLL
jgi:hypothetical protein